MKNIYKSIIVVLLTIVIAVLDAGCERKDERMKEQAPKKIQEPLVAGQFYPRDPQAIKEMIDIFFEQVPDMNLGPNLIGAVCPHAGYIYSGPIAAYVYKNLPKDVFRKVVIVFPSHYQQFRGVLALDVDQYRTPLGLIDVDRTSIKALMDSDPAVFYKEGKYYREHSMEVLLPFLQVSLGEDFQIVPLMMGDQTPRMAKRLANDLQELFGDQKVLYIASTDMSHYHPYNEANALDSRALTHIINLDDLALIDDLRRGRTELCGYGPVLTLMYITKLKGLVKARVLKHANSGDTQGDKSRVVGYAAVAFFSGEPPAKEGP